MIGTRALMGLFLLALGLVLADWANLFNSHYVKGIAPVVLVWASFFAVVFGRLMYSFWRLWRRSEHYLRFSLESWLWEDETLFLSVGRLRIALGKNEGDAFDLPASVHYVNVIVLFFVLGLATFNLRTLDLITALPDVFQAGGAGYCPDPDAEEAVEEVVDPGCILVRRAFELGYAKDLGPCAPKEDEEEKEVCLLRQLDEPLLHFAWRRLYEFESRVRGVFTVATAEKMRDVIETKAEYIEPLYRAQRDFIASAPRSSHHIWFSLPEPRGWAERVLQGDLTAGARCERYRALLPRPDVGSEASRVGSRRVEHVMAQLVFDTRYDDPAGHCREYHLHWGADPDTCERLVRDPESTLRRHGVWQEVHNVRRRLDDRRVIEQLDRMLGDVPQPAPDQSKEGEPAPETEPNEGSALRSAVSFQCYVEAEVSKPSVVWRTLDLGGTPFDVAEMRIPQRRHDGRRLVRQYGQISKLLVRGFHYGKLASQASPLALIGTETEGEQSFAQTDGYLSRLEMLADMDIFVGDEWLLQRPDLLDVYPYHVHLGNLVETFRRRYTREKGRL